jgi:hypothetical protein
MKVRYLTMLGVVLSVDYNNVRGRVDIGYF